MDKNKPRPYHRGRVHEDLIECADDILKNETVDAITVRRLTTTIGVTPANFYNHFENLNELLAHLAARKLREMKVQMDASRKRHRKPLLRIRASAREFVHMAMSSPQAYNLMFGSLTGSLNRYPAYRDASEDAFEAFVNDLYGEAIYDRNNLKASHERCLHGYALFALLNGLARDVIDGLVSFDEPQEIDRFTDRMVESLLLGTAHADLKHRLA